MIATTAPPIPIPVLTPVDRPVAGFAVRSVLRSSGWFVSGTTGAAHVALPPAISKRAPQFALPSFKSVILMELSFKGLPILGTQT